MTRAIGAALALVAALSAAATAQDDAVARSLDAYVAAGVEDWGSPGLAVAIVADGRVVLSKGYGVRKLGESDAVDEHTLFAIGSTTKAMTAAAVGMLVDENELGWDDKVVDHLPWFRVADPFVTRELTVRDLLTHRGGLPNTDFLWYGRDNSPRDILERMRWAPQETSMRSAFTYQNVMYAAAGAVVESASGMTWESFITERIFEPLGMSRSLATAKTLSEQTNVAAPHFRIDGTVEVIENMSVDPVAPAGSVWSSVHDMSLWMRFLLSGETLDGERLLSEASLDELFTPQTLVDPEEFYPTQRLTRPHWMTYGLGWFQHDYAGRAVDFHTGSIDGMVAIHGLLRSEGVGVYVLGNLDHVELRHAIMYRVFDAFIGADGSGRDWSAELRSLYRSLEQSAEDAAAAETASRVTGTSPTLPLTAYEGRYRDRLFGAAVVSGERELRLSLGPGLSGRLTHWHYDTFRVDWDAEWRGHSLVSFKVGPAGRVRELEVGGARYGRE